MEPIKTLTGAHRGPPCYIVGKGPSLDRLKASAFVWPDAPVIAINEAITKVEWLELPNPVYSLQQDGNPACMRRPKRSPLILGPRSKDWFPEHPRRIYFEPEALGIRADAFTAESAIAIADLFNVERLIMIAFDACVDGNLGYAGTIGSLHYDQKNRWRFKEHCNRMKALAAKLDLPMIYRAAAPQELPRVAVVTPTGDRPETFKHAREYVFRQTVQPERWIVVDDGLEPLPEALRRDCTYIRRERSATDPAHTLPVNMGVALDRAIADDAIDAVVIMEDDDWYHPTHVAEMARRLSDFDLVGEANSLYYFVPRALYAYCGNDRHASFCQTAFSRQAFGFFREICSRAAREGQCFIDLMLWREWTGKKILFERPEAPLCVGLKGLPGRPGQTSGHRAEGPGWTYDARAAHLTSLIGADVARYKPLILPEQRSPLSSAEASRRLAQAIELHARAVEKLSEALTR